MAERARRGRGGGEHEAPGAGGSLRAGGGNRAARVYAGQPARGAAAQAVASPAVSAELAAAQQAAVAQSAGALAAWVAQIPPPRWPSLSGILTPELTGPVLRALPAGVRGELLAEDPASAASALAWVSARDGVALYQAADEGQRAMLRQALPLEALNAIALAGDGGAGTAAGLDDRQLRRAQRLNPRYARRLGYGPDAFGREPKDSAAFAEAVAAFQAEHGLAIDGIAGPQTWAARQQELGQLADQLEGGTGAPAAALEDGPSTAPAGSAVHEPIGSDFDPAAALEGGPSMAPAGAAVHEPMGADFDPAAELEGGPSTAPAGSAAHEPMGAGFDPAAALEGGPSTPAAGSGPGDYDPAAILEKSERSEQSGHALEANADAVADAVVVGRAAPPILRAAPATGPARKRREDSEPAGEGAPILPASTGAALPTDSRNRLEGSLGTPLDGVRVHTGAASQAAAVQLNARAFTVGQDIHFAAGEYNPSSTEGEHLLAHEVAHTVQQAGSVQLQRKEAGSRAQAAAEASDELRIAEARRSGGTLPARLWAQGNALPLQQFAEQHLVATDVPLPDPRLHWTSDSRALTRRLMATIRDSGPQPIANLKRVLAPVDLLALIDRTRLITRADGPEGPEGPPRFYPEVAIEVASALRQRLAESLARIAPQYVAASREAGAQSSGGDDTAPATDTAPAVSPAALVPGHPLDRCVIAIVCGHALLDVAPGEGPAAARRRHQPDLVRFAWLTGRGSLGWLRVHEPADATPEEVAEAVYGSPEHAHRLTVATPLFGLPPTDVAQLRGGPAGGILDAMLTLTRGERADDPTAHLGAAVTDEIALAQTSLAGAADADSDAAGGASVEEALGVNDTMAEAIAGMLAPYALDAELAPLRAFLSRKRAELGGASASAAAPWITHARVCGDLLVGIAHELAPLREQLASMRAPDAERLAALGRAVAEPAQAVLRLLGRAAGSAHLPGVGAGLFAEARQQRRLLATSTIEILLSDSLQRIEGMQGVASENLRVPGGVRVDDDILLEDYRQRQQALRVALADLRARIAAGEVDPAAIEHLTNQAAALQLEASLVAGIAHTSEIVAIVEPLRWEQMMAAAGQDEDLTAVMQAGAILRGRLAAIYRDWRAEQAALARSVEQTIEASPDFRDTAAAEGEARAAALTGAFAARLEAVGGEPGVAAFLQHACDEIQDAQVKALIMQVALMIGVSIVASGVVGVAAAAARGAWLGSAGAAAAELSAGARVAGGAARIVAEAGLNAAGQTALQGGDFGTMFAENAVADAATLAVLRPLQQAFRTWGAADEAALGIWQKVGRGGRWAVREGVELSAMTITGAASSYVVHRLAAGEQPPSPQTATEWAVQGASMAVGKFVHSRLRDVQARLDELGQMGGEQVASGLRRRTGRALERADALQETGSRADAFELLATHRAVLDEEIRILEGLAADPEARARSGLHRGAIEQRLDRLRSEAGDTTAAGFPELPMRLAGMEELVPGAVWRGSAGQIELGLHEARRAGADVEVLDRGDARKRWTVRLGERVVRIHQTGLAEVHNHIIGVPDVDYFIVKAGDGSAFTLLDRMFAIFQATPEAQKGGADSWKATQRAVAGLDRMKAADATPDEQLAFVQSELVKILAAGEETAFDHTYEIRDLLIQQYIDPGRKEFRNFARDTLEMLHEDNIDYVEQSTSHKKIANRFPEQMMDDVHKELGAQGKDVDVRFLAMYPTGMFGAKGQTPEGRVAFEGLNEHIRLLLNRGDVLGVDIAGPEEHAFTPEGMQRFGEVFDLVSEAARLRERPMVLRPHVGEGYVPKEGGGAHDHVELARGNVEALLQFLEARGYSPDRDMVIIRFGHATHASPDQIRRMQALGIIAEANIGSNLATGSIARLGDHPLLYNLYYGTKTILSTDAHGVMGTDLSREYAKAEDLILDFREDVIKIEIDGVERAFDSLSAEEQARFSVQTLQQWADEYHRAVRLADRTDKTREHRQ